MVKKLCIFDEFINEEKECYYSYDCRDCKIKHDIGVLICEVQEEEVGKFKGASFD